VRFLGRPPGEPIVTIPATPAIRACLAMLNGGADLTATEVAARLAGSAEREQQVGRFLQRLMDLGLLHRQTPVPDLAVDPIGAMVSWLVKDGPDATAVMLQE